MKLQNPQQVTIQEILPRLQTLYPTAVAKKFWLTPEMISIPQGGYRLFVRRRKNGLLTTDFNPPIGWNLLAMLGVIIIISLVFSMLLRGPVIGGLGGLSAVLAITISKGIFKSRHKELLERFDRDVAQAVEGPQGTSIF